MREKWEDMVERVSDEITYRLRVSSAREKSIARDLFGVSARILQKLPDLITARFPVLKPSPDQQDLVNIWKRAAAEPGFPGSYGSFTSRRILQDGTPFFVFRTVPFRVPSDSLRPQPYTANLISFIHNDPLHFMYLAKEGITGIKILTLPRFVHRTKDIPVYMQGDESLTVFQNGQTIRMISDNKQESFFSLGSVEIETGKEWHVWAYLTKDFEKVYGTGNGRSGAIVYDAPGVK